jgi:glycerate kinase
MGGMRVLIAPDKFAGTLTAVEAAAAIEEGWRRRDPDAEVLVAPMADGGPGFIDVLSAVVDGTLLSVTVRGPLGDEVPATVLVADETAYVETAQACGLHLVEKDQRRPEDGTTYGVGQLIAASMREPSGSSWGSVARGPMTPVRGYLPRWAPPPRGETLHRGRPGWQI